MKYLLKKLLIPFLASRPIASLATRFIGSGIPIFLLHRMAREGQPANGRTSPEHLRRCLQYLIDNGHTFLSLEQLVLGLRHKQALPPKGVVFTMDDGYQDQAEIAAPIFLEFECPLTFFVITGMLDGSLWPWDAQVSWIIEATNKPVLKTNITGNTLVLKLDGRDEKRLARHTIQDILRETDAADIPPVLMQLAQDAAVELPQHAPPPYLPMTWEMARQLEHRGIQFAPHSVTHNIVSRLNEASLKTEIHDSWNALERQLIKPLKVFGYPSGRAIDFGRREIQALKDLNFLGAAATTPHFVETGYQHENQIFSLPRLPLPESMDDFIQYCSWIEYAKSNRGKLSTPKT